MTREILRHALLTLPLAISPARAGFNYVLRIDTINRQALQIKAQRCKGDAAFHWLLFRSTSSGDGAAHADGLHLSAWLCDQSGRIDAEPGGGHLPKTLGDRAHALELQAGLGLGEHQVSGDTHRSETSVGIAVLAYLFVLCVCHHEIVPGKPWSLFSCNICVVVTGHDEPSRA